MNAYFQNHNKLLKIYIFGYSRPSKKIKSTISNAKIALLSEKKSKTLENVKTLRNVPQNIPSMN